VARTDVSRRWEEMMAQFMDAAPVEGAGEGDNGEQWLSEYFHMA